VKPKPLAICFVAYNIKQRPQSIACRSSAELLFCWMFKLIYSCYILPTIPQFSL